MASAPGTIAKVGAIPVIDLLAGSAAEQIVEAAEEVGFFSIIGHEVDRTTRATLRSAVVELFSVSDEDKHRQAITRDNYRGFIPLGFFTPNRAERDEQADLYEGFKLHWEVDASDPICELSPIYGPNRWPDHPQNLPNAVGAYWAACDRVASRLVGIFEDALGQPAGSMLDRFEFPVTNMTLLHYPPSDGSAMGIHPHKDTNVLTILEPDALGGLFVRTREGEWIEPKPPPGALVINIGDMLEVWSGGRFVSTPHKVINTSGQDRYAYPWFMAPSHDQLIEPLVESQPGFTRSEPIEVGPWSLEVWRTNWSDATAKNQDLHLGTLDQ